MFTGIIEELGKIRGIKKDTKSAELSILASKVLEDVKIGDSIAVNGICFTVKKFDENGFFADAMHETLNRSSLSGLKVGSKVNLERAMPANGRFGGHIVAGHVDGTGKIKSIKKDGIAIWYYIETEPSILKYIVEKGSIAIDGISLTVASVDRSSFSVSIIPHTAQNTTLLGKQVGDIVNLENDCVGKYIEKFLGEAKKNNGITREYLAKFGF